MSQDTPILFRQFVPADIPFAMELKNLAGWNQTEQDWSGYLEFEPEGCFVAEREGRAAGTAITIRYGREAGWIGMVLVHPRFRRAGIGTRLLNHAIGHLRSRGVSAIKLDATPVGRTVYLPLGFQDEYAVKRYEGVLVKTAGAEPGPDVVSLARPAADVVAAFDRDCFGVERGRVLDALRRRDPSWCWIARSRTGIAGYLMAREGHEAVQLGPWVSRDEGIAARLLRALARHTGGRRMLVDIPAPNGNGQALMQREGFVIQRNFTRMYLGTNTHPGDPASIFGTGGAEIG